jgi:hypothetical protein
VIRFVLTGGIIDQHCYKKKLMMNISFSEQFGFIKICNVFRIEKTDLLFFNWSTKTAIYFSKIVKFKGNIYFSAKCLHVNITTKKK